MAIPVVIAWTVGAAVGTAMVRVLAKEWRRVNATLHAEPAEPAETVVREALPKLRRDPRTGVYRPG